MLATPDSPPPPDVGTERALFLSSRYGKGPTAAQYGLRQGRWRLVRFDDGASDRRFDLERDPEERHDLAADEPDRVAVMRAPMARRRGELRARARVSSEAELDPETLETIRTLGYAGGGLDPAAEQER